jgi:hemoglobin
VKIAKAVLAVGFALLCGMFAARAAKADDALYQDLGQRPGITQIVDHMMVHVLSDDRIKEHFADTNIDRLKGMLVNYFQMTAGGPDIYKGSRDMRVIHAGMHLRNSDFNALVEDLQKGMDDAQIPFATQNRLLARLAPKQKEIVTR